MSPRDPFNREMAERKILRGQRSRLRNALAEWTDYKAAL